ncbi:hypothetical protein GALMADRAFT_715796 [Galerina marginata CBS 339.88]|uniref:Uncharacterized protein n=1 Tax=Galerina marginata (strain CBS 339.88) TaxID=685588 RepID=A0A067TQD0_GALM3|nr:hypothetical protein GALMADRAFT_715796 [Galerina marginata CBS 339.88]
MPNASEAPNPEADEAYTYTLADLDTIIGNHLRLGISTLTELADYHRRFTAITNFLISKSRLSEMEQKRAFILGFQPTLWSRISQRLQLTLPDQVPDEPYEIEVVHAAAWFVLHGTSSMVNLLAPPQSTSSAAHEPVVNSDTLAPLFAEFTKSILEVLKQNQNQNQPEQHQLENNLRRARVTNHGITGACNFCRKPPHSIRGCK